MAVPCWVSDALPLLFFQPFLRAACQCFKVFPRVVAVQHVNAEQASACAQ